MLDPTQQPTQQVPASPPPPTFPQSRIDVVPEGVVLIVALTPTLQISQFVDDATMTAIDRRRLEVKKQQRDNLNIVRDINRANTPH